MSVTAEFEVMKKKIWDAIDNTLQNDVADFTKKSLQATMLLRVYSYQATPWAMRKRRGDLGGLADTYEMVANVTQVGQSGRFHELQVESLVGPQGLGDVTQVNLDDDWGPNDGLARNIAMSRASGVRLDKIVEDGDRAWHQPGPRPFYKETERFVAVESGVLGALLRNGLISAGFEVI